MELHEPFFYLAETHRLRPEDLRAVCRDVEAICVKRIINAHEIGDVDCRTANLADDAGPAECHPRILCRFTSEPPPMRADILLKLHLFSEYQAQCGRGSLLKQVSG